MKRLFIIILGLVIIGVIGYVVFYLISSDPNISSDAEIFSDTPEKFVVLSDSQQISEWREEDRTGVSDEKGLMKSWPKEGPQLIWSNVELPKGHSSVSFGNNSIYLTGLDGQKELLVSLDKYGKVKWQTPYGNCWNQNSESRCTPTVEGNRVYVSSGNGEVVCIDAESGVIIWSVKASETYNGTFGQWGIAESLIIDGQKLYYTPGGSETTTIALEKNTGNLIWKSESIQDGPAYVSPVLVEYEGRKLIINISLRNVFAVDASDGTILWKINHLDFIDSKKSIEGWPDAPLIKCVTPLYFNGKIYITGGYDHGGALLSLKDGGNNVTVDWTDEVLDVHHGGVVLVNGYIYGSNWLNNGNGNWCCIEWNTGKKMYEEHWKCKGSIISAEGMLYIYDERSGYVGLVRANPEKFDLISSFKVKEGSGSYWAHPVINNGVLFLRHSEALMAYDIKER